MPITTSDMRELILPGLRAEFALAYRNEIDNSTFESLATVIQTTQPSQRYGWLGAAPAMREFTDERRPTGLAAYSTTIEDKTFEATIAVERKALEDDQLDVIRLRIRDLASRVAAHRHQLLAEALGRGFSATGYDGVPFFSNSHPTGPTTASNVTSDALAEASLAAGITTMMSLEDDQAIPLGIVPDTLVVWPKLQWLARELVESPVVVYRGNDVDTAPSTPFKNVIEGRLRLIVSPYLRGTNDDRWFILDTTRAVRGLILQQRSDVPVEFSALDSRSGSESAFMRDLFYYGVRARYNVGYGMWQAAFGGDVI